MSNNPNATSQLGCGGSVGVGALIFLLIVAHVRSGGLWAFTLTRVKLEKTGHKKTPLTTSKRGKLGKATGLSKNQLKNTKNTKNNLE